jgi:hypothetical protein
MQPNKDFVIKKRETSNYYLPKAKLDNLEKSREESYKSSLSYRPSSKTKIMIARSTHNLNAFSIGGSPRNLDGATLSHRQSKTTHFPSPLSTLEIQTDYLKQSSNEDNWNNVNKSHIQSEAVTPRLAKSPKFHTPSTKASSGLHSSKKLTSSCFELAARAAVLNSNKQITESSLTEK